MLFRKDSGALLERFLARKCVDDRIRSLARSFSDLQDVASCLLLPPGARVGRLPLIVEVHLGMVPRCEPALVHEPRRCEGKAGGLAWRLVWMAPALQGLFEISASLGRKLTCVRPVFATYMPLALMVSANQVPFYNADG
ncbi:MAG TPA: hypothetical protein DCL16_07925 [Acidimicrobiaceae bacterium]|nr:hypothetical protein [Acidimicrobiaceae bacterium]